MIQRIQTVYFLIAILVLLGFLFTPILHIVDPVDGIGASLSVFYMDPETKSFILRSSWGNDTDSFSSVLSYIILSEVLTVSFLLGITIFQYRNRSKQILLSKIIMSVLGILAGIVLIYVFTVNPSEGIEVNYVRSYGAYFPIFALIATYLGYRGVKSDDELIKSADRIR